MIDTTAHQGVRPAADEPQAGSGVNATAGMSCTPIARGGGRSSACFRPGGGIGESGAGGEG